MLQADTHPLPKLRQELRLFEGAPTNKGQPTWLIYDPVRHRYFRLTQDVFELLSLWDRSNAEELKIHAENILKREVTSREISDLIHFLHANNLTETSASGDSRDYVQQILANTKSFWKTIIHSYLFFRIPLFRPENFLKATLPIAEVFFSRAARNAIIIIGVIGIYLASRQWEEFSRTFLDFLTLEGALYYAISLVFIKILHELGHAYTAARNGVRVNTMGVAFMVMMPLLYTDVTDAWRLKSRKSKLAIDAAGMAVELSVAALATFLWAFLPDGHAKSVAFVLATTSWIMSLLVNLNPFMRFDGYYILSDAWGIPNLQPRSFELARWRLREALFGLNKTPPEQFSPLTRRMLILYAFGTWIYRFLLFLGIALLVYHFFFKALGIILFAVEILWFIVLPAWREIMEWWKMRNEICQTKRSLITASVLAILAILALVPWNSTISFQALASAQTEQQVFAPTPAHVARVFIQNDQHVERGDILAQLTSPDLNFNLTQTEREIALLEARFARIAGDREDRLLANIITSELAAAKQKLSGLQKEQAQLTIRAPIAGTVKDVDSDLANGQWIDRKTPIARIVVMDKLQAVGYINEDNIWRVQTNDTAKFIPEDFILPAQDGHLLEIAKAGASRLDVSYLSSVYGGEVASERDPDGNLVPRKGQYLVRVALDPSPLQRAVRGTIHITGKPESFAASLWRRVLQVLVRESGV